MTRRRSTPHARPGSAPSQRQIFHAPADALDAFCATADFERAQILVLLLDHEHTGAACLAVDDVRSADSIVQVAELLADLAGQDIGLDAVVLASVRPSAGVELADVDRWDAVAARLATAGGPYMAKAPVQGRRVGAYSSLLLAVSPFRTANGEGGSCGSGGLNTAPGLRGKGSISRARCSTT